MRFKRGLSPMEPYRLRTRVIGWDSKWLFLEQCFVGIAGRTKAAGLCKMVLTDAGRQIAPAEALCQLGWAADVKEMAKAAEAAGGEPGHCMPVAARASE